MTKTNSQNALEMKCFSSDDTAYMAEAIRLAKKGLYTTDPNPRVGCVIVRDGEVVGRGWHKKAGSGHAEVNALKEAGERAKGACAYVTLEPCSHYGRTPPCAEALIAAGVSHVIAAMKDPNPEVSGRGFALLSAKGISVASGLLESQARDLNPGFIKRMECQRPWVRIKMAISVDGRTAMQSGESQWITGPHARADVQRLRARSSAVMTGIGTLLQDDAMLTVRSEQLILPECLGAELEGVGAELEGVAAELEDMHEVSVEDIVEQQPLRVVLDSQAKMSINAKLLSNTGPVLWVVSEEAALNEEAQAIARLSHVELCKFPSLHQNNSLEALLVKLSKQGCNELLVEAGAKLVGSFIELDLWDELVIYMAPKLLGSDARALAVLPFTQMSQAKNMQLKDMRIVGDDIRLTYVPDRSNLN